MAGALINTVNLSAQVFVNAASPEFGSDWSFRPSANSFFPPITREMHDGTSDYKPLSHCWH